MTKLYSRQAENAVKISINQREITHRHYEVQLWFFHTALCIITTNKNTKFQVKLQTKNYSNKLSNSRKNNSTCSGSDYTHNGTHMRSHGPVSFDQVWY